MPHREQPPSGEQEAVEVNRPPYERMDDREAGALTEGFMDREGTYDEAPELRQSLARLILELRDRLPDYGTILSDETSGRLPSLIIRKLVKNAREKQGRDTPRHNFISGGDHRTIGREQDDVVGEYLTENGNDMKERGRVALVTEFISSGDTIGPIVTKLEDLGIDFDLICVSVSRDPYNYPDVIQRHLIYGDQGGAGLRFWAKDNTGVAKGGKANPHTVAIRRHSGIAIKKAREDAENISLELQELLDTAPHREYKNMDDREPVAA